MEKELSAMQSRIQELQDDVLNKRYWTVIVEHLFCHVHFGVFSACHTFSNTVAFLFSFKLLRESRTHL